MTISKPALARPTVDCSDDIVRTKQEFKDECDINNILAKFRRTGRITHIREHGARYGDATLTSYEEAMLTIAGANTLWEDLPSDLRNKFGGIKKFLAWQEKASSAEIKQLFGEAPPSPAETEAPEAPSDAAGGVEPPKEASPPTTES